MAKTYDTLNNVLHHFHRHTHPFLSTQSLSFDTDHCRTSVDSIGCHAPSQSSSVFGMSLWLWDLNRKDVVVHHCHRDTRWWHCRTHTLVDIRLIYKGMCLRDIVETCGNHNFLHLRCPGIEFFRRKERLLKHIFRCADIWMLVGDIAL